MSDYRAPFLFTAVMYPLFKLNLVTFFGGATDRFNIRQYSHGPAFKVWLINTTKYNYTTGIKLYFQQSVVYNPHLIFF